MKIPPSAPGPRARRKDKDEDEKNTAVECSTHQSVLDLYLLLKIDTYLPIYSRFICKVSSHHHPRNHTSWSSSFKKEKKEKKEKIVNCDECFIFVGWYLTFWKILLPYFTCFLGLLLDT